MCSLTFRSLQVCWKERGLQSRHISILVLKSENSVAECACVLLKTVGKHFLVAEMLCGRVRLYLLPP